MKMLLVVALCLCVATSVYANISSFSWLGAEVTFAGNTPFWQTVGDPFCALAFHTDFTPDAVSAGMTIKWVIETSQFPSPTPQDVFSVSSPTTFSASPIALVRPTKANLGYLRVRWEPTCYHAGAYEPCVSGDGQAFARIFMTCMGNSP